VHDRRAKDGDVPGVCFDNAVFGAPRTVAPHSAGEDVVVDYLLLSPGKTHRKCNETLSMNVVAKSGP
jgi:hypothetical protein